MKSFKIVDLPFLCWKRCHTAFFTPEKIRASLSLLFFFFLSVKLSVRAFGLKSSLYTTTIYLLTDLATLSHHYCKLTMDAHVQKESLVQKPICWPSKIEKNIPNETEKKTTNGFSYIFSYVL